MASLHRAVLIALVLGSGLARAQQPAPAGMSQADAAARRFPQPVRVGDLIGRTVQQPLESQPVLGTVRQVVRSHDGGIEIVVDYGGVLGFGSRPVAVPADAMALLGQVMEIVDLTPQQLGELPTFSPAAVTTLRPDETIRVGLARPSH